MEDVRRVAVAVVAGLLGPAAVLDGAALLPPAAAASCAVMTISVKPHSLVGLSLNSLSVVKGGCVEFANTTSNSVIVTVVGTSYSQTVPARGTTSGSSNYIVTKTVTVQASGGLRSGSATITATAAPTPSHSPSPAPSPTHSSSPHPSANTTPSPSASRHRHRRGQSGRAGRPGHRAKVSLPPLPPLPTDGLTAQPQGSDPVVAPGLTSTTAAPSPPTSSATTPVATVVEPVAGNKRGLPALIAIVLLIGLIAAYGRAVLAYAPAVDNPPQRGHRA